jgi:hypothetical protein
MTARSTWRWTVGGLSSRYQPLLATHAVQLATRTVQLADSTTGLTANDEPMPAGGL